MYVGTVYDFFYKPKNWIFQQPKFDQKQDKAYININGRIYRINELNGEMILCNTLPKKINFAKSEKQKKIKLKNKLNINSITKGKDKDDENYSNNYMNSENIKSISARDTKFKDFLLKSPALTDIKSDKNKNTITSDNNSTLQNDNLRKNKNNKLKYIAHKNNINFIKYNYFNNKSIEQIINSNNFSTNLNSLKNSIFQNSIKNDKLFGNKTILYFNKTNKKYFKPKIAFGQKILKSLSVKDKKRYNKKNNINLLYLIYKQHNNNIKGEGRTNEKIYDKENGDNIIFKAYKDQIFKEKIEIGLKKKYNFFEDNNNGDLKVPLITHQNFCFYRGYSFSDNRRTPIDHKLFFKYIKKDKLKEQKESGNKKRNKY